MSKRRIGSYGAKLMMSRQMASIGCALLFALPHMAHASETLHECLLAPSLVVEASTAVEGVLASVAVGRGDRVARGDVVATLEDTVETAIVDQARARAAMRASVRVRELRRTRSARKLKRALALEKKQFISPDELDELRTSLEQSEQEHREVLELRDLARIDLRRAEAELAMRTLRSPIDGVVAERYLAAGEFAQAQPIVRLAQLDPLHVETVLPVELFGRIELGDSARVELNAPLAREVVAKVTVIDRVIDAASGTFRVRLHLDNPDYVLPAGIECGVEFRGGT